MLGKVDVLQHLWVAWELQAKAREPGCCHLKKSVQMFRKIILPRE